jgi:hypothetical protein
VGSLAGFVIALLVVASVSVTASKKDQGFQNLHMGLEVTKNDKSPLEVSQILRALSDVDCLSNIRVTSVDEYDVKELVDSAVAGGFFCYTLAKLVSFVGYGIEHMYCDKDSTCISNAKTLQSIGDPKILAKKVSICARASTVAYVVGYRVHLKADIDRSSTCLENASAIESYVFSALKSLLSSSLPNARVIYVNSR